jgi:uncharacterized protein YjiS (DUF1127 family)
MLTKLIRTAVTTIKDAIEHADVVYRLERLSDRQLADMGLERASLRRTIRHAMSRRDARAHGVGNAEVYNALWAFDEQVLSESAANSDASAKAKVA